MITISAGLVETEEIYIMYVGSAGQGKPGTYTCSLHNNYCANFRQSITQELRIM